MYKRQHGHCRVPNTYPVDQSLAHWVSKQRENIRNNRLHHSRKAKLDSLGFLWRVTGRDVLSLPLKNLESTDEPSERQEPKTRSRSKRKRDLTIPVNIKREDGKVKSKKRCHYSGEHPTRIGTRLAIYWPNCDEYFPGVLSKTNPNGKVYIRYDDGDKQWIHLEEVSYFFLTDPATDRRPDNPPLSHLEIGTRLSVWWQSEKEFFEGTLVEKRKDRQSMDPHRVEYADGDEEWVNLAFRRFRLLGDDTEVLKKEE